MGFVATVCLPWKRKVLFKLASFFFVGEPELLYLGSYDNASRRSFSKLRLCGYYWGLLWFYYWVSTKILEFLFLFFCKFLAFQLSYYDFIFNLGSLLLNCYHDFKFKLQIVWNFNRIYVLIIFNLNEVFSVLQGSRTMCSNDQKGIFIILQGTQLVKT